MAHRPRLFLVAVDGRRIGAYKSGRKRARGTPVASSTSSTRLSGTLPALTQLLTAPCPIPSLDAKPCCVPALAMADLRAFSSGESSGSSSMDGQNITIGNIRATTQSDFLRAHYHRMGKSGPVSEYWKRLTSMPSFKGSTQTGIAKTVLRITGTRYGQTGIQKWKSGASEPPVSLSRQLAAHDGYAAEWLISGQGNPRPNDTRVDWPFPEVSYDRVVTMLRQQPHLLPIIEGEIKSCLLRLEINLDRQTLEQPRPAASPAAPPQEAARARKAR